MISTLIRKPKLPLKSLITIGILPSFLKKIIYRMKGYKIGKNVSLGFGSVIIGEKVVIENGVQIGLVTVIRAKEISIEQYASIGSFTFIDTAKLRIGEDARINEQVIIGGMQTPKSCLDLGQRTIIMEYSFINTTMPIKIGDDTGIGGHCLLFTHGSWLSCLDGFPVTFAPITIGNNVWLPWRIFIMPGTIIGDNVVIGANSLVSGTQPSNVLIAGNPAKIIRETYPPALKDDERKNILDNVFKEFCEYLIFNNCEIQNKENEFMKQYLITRKKKHHSLFYLKEHKPDVFATPNAVIIQDYSCDLKKLSFAKNVLVANLQQKERIGTSEVGEEFIKFLSRYGIRFNRID